MCDEDTGEIVIVIHEFQALFRGSQFHATARAGGARGGGPRFKRVKQ